MKLAENLQMLRKEKGLSQENLADFYDVSLDELVGRRKEDKFVKLKEYIRTFAAKDIPVDKDDEISAIVVRYLLFVERMGLTAEERLKGLQEIFLTEHEWE